MNNTQHPDTTTPRAEQDLEDLQVGVSQALTALSLKLRDAQRLTDSRQRGLGFATADAKRAMDEQLVKEREGRLWNQINGFPTGSGEVPVPGNLSAWAFQAQAHADLSHQVRRIVRELARSGVCTTLRVGPEPTLNDLISHIRALMWDVKSTRLLKSVLRTLEYLIEDATRLVDGHDRSQLDAPCPHCGRRTLVVYFQTGVIRCDKDPHSGEFENCVCPDPICDCKTRPQFRHEWHRDKGTSPNGWWKLADRLNLTKQITR